MRFALILLSFFTLLIVTACAAPRTQTPGVSDDELRAETALQQQKSAEREIEKQRVSKEKRLKMEDRLLRVSTKILKGGIPICSALAVETMNCVYDFKLLEDGPINAYTDGKTIHVSPAMMNFAKSDNELAYVLGHEYGHNVMGHHASLRTNALAGALLGAVFDGVAAAHGVDTGGAITDAGAKAGALTYSKAFEAEADYVGLYVSAASGYDISPAGDLWRRMSEKKGVDSGVSLTHPGYPERFIAMAKTVKEIHGKKQKGQKLLPKLKADKELQN